MSQFVQVTLVHMGHSGQLSARHHNLVQEDLVFAHLLYATGNIGNPINTQAINPVEHLNVLAVVEHGLDSLEAIVPTLELLYRAVPLLQPLSQSIRYLTSHFGAFVEIKVVIDPSICVGIRWREIRV